jgi:hypothetical protein
MQQEDFQRRLGPMRLLCVIVVIFALFLLVFHSSSLAEDSYSWVDHNGHVIYGSTPPKDAQSVKKLPTKYLSRYSSDKMLKRLGWNTSKTPHSAKGEKKDFRPAQPVTLEQGDLRIEFNEQQQITSCVVPLRNTGANNAAEISLAFDFPDGTLVPGVGPDSIAANSAADYSIPKELLPLTIRLEPGKEQDQNSIMPKVIIHGIGQ